VNIEDIFIKDGNVEILNSSISSTDINTGALLISGGIGISNTTDAVSQDNGGTFTTAGGIGVKKKAYIGDSLYVDNFLGVGTVNPRKRLTVFDSSDTELAIISNDQSNASILYLGTPQNALGISGAYKAAIIAQGTNSNSRSDLHFCLNTSTGNTSSSDADISDAKMTLTNNGFLGIGITDPDRLFHVQGNQGIWRLDRDANTVGLQLHRFPSGNFSTPWKGFLIGVNASGVNNGEFVISDYGTSVGGPSSARILINNSGNVGINSGSPTEKLTVVGTGSISGNTSVGANLTVSGNTFLNDYFQTVNIPSPTNPPSSNIRFYTDQADSLLKSKNSSGVLTTYQPTTTKGDLLTHNGTTQQRLSVDSIDDSYLISDSTTLSGLNWFNKAYACVRDVKTSGTNGGTASSGSWFERVFNNIISYPSGQTFISLTGIRITLEPGNYYIKSRCPGNSVGLHTSRIVDWTDLVVLFNGTSATSSTSGFLSGDDQSETVCSGILSVTTVKVIGLQHRVSSTNFGDGLGLAAGFQSEVYSIMEIFKI